MISLWFLGYKIQIPQCPSGKWRNTASITSKGGINKQWQMEIVRGRQWGKEISRASKIRFKGWSWCWIRCWAFRRCGWMLRCQKETIWSKGIWQISYLCKSRKKAAFPLNTFSISLWYPHLLSGIFLRSFQMKSYQQIPRLKGFSIHKTTLMECCCMWWTRCWCRRVFCQNCKRLRGWIKIENQEVFGRRYCLGSWWKKVVTMGKGVKMKGLRRKEGRKFGSLW